MPLWEAAMGGSQGGYHRIRVNVDLITQEVVNNRSLIRYSAWMERVNSTSYTYNYATTYGSTNINGYNPGRSIGGYYSDNAGERWYLAQNEDYWINHDANGNATPYFDAYYNPDNSPYLTAASVAANYTLPNINRYPSVTGFTLTGPTDVKFTANVTTDYTCDLLEYSLDGAAWVTAYSGLFTSRSFDVGGTLISNRQYSLRLRVRRSDTGFQNESNTAFITTAEQGRMINTMGL